MVWYYSMALFSDEGGTSAIYIFMAQLALFNEGYETIFQYVGIFVRYFLWRGVLYCFPMHMTMVWDLAKGAGILAPSDAITQTSISVDRRGWGFPSSTAGPKA